MSDRKNFGFDFEVVQDAVRQPSLDQLYATARARRRRRSSAVALVAIVALAGVSFVPLASRRPGTDPVQPETTPRPPSAAVLSDLFLFGEKSAVAVQVTDDGCTVGFALTSDFGRTWSPFRQLRHEGACDRGGETTYRPLTAHTYAATVDGRSYLSSDEGRTWRDARTAMSVVRAFPPRAEPVVCGAGCTGLSEPLAVDPEAGAVFRLGGKPSPDRLTSMYESLDGALWATFASPDLQTPSSVARSVDRGATWRISSGPGGTDVGGVVGESADVAYLLAEPRQSGAGAYTSGRSRLLRTIDGGRNWADVSTNLPTAGAIRPFTLGSDGSLLVVDGPIADAGANCSIGCDENERYVWVSRDGGRIFTKGPAVPGVVAGVMPGRVWVLRQDLGGGQEAHVTSDGRTWIRLPLPS